MKKIIFIFMALITISLNCQSTYAQWVQRYSEQFGDVGLSLAIDDSGNVFITGYTNWPSKIITIKYNPYGVQQWLQIYNEIIYDEGNGRSIKLDPAGNIYVSGSTGSSMEDQNFILIKYNSSGVQQWARIYKSPEIGSGSSSNIVIDQSGNIYSAGSSNGIGTLRDFTIIKYNSDGDSLWVRRYNGSANSYDQINSIALDNFGNVYVTGYIKNIGTNYDYATIKYDSSGNLKWVQIYKSTSDVIDKPWSMSIDQYDNVYVTGESNGDYLTIKYNSNGDSLWVRRHNDGYASCIKVDHSGNAYVTGESGATVKYDSTGNQEWVRAGAGIQGVSIELDGTENVYVGGRKNLNYIVVKYSFQGIQKWMYQYCDGTESWDNLQDMKVDFDGNVYLTGSSYLPIHGNDILTIKCSENTLMSLELTVLPEGMFDSNTNLSVKDTVFVYLREANTPYSLIDSAKSVLDSTGHCVLNFTIAVNCTGYYMIIKHRNSIETWSSQTKTFTNNQLIYDFTTSANMAYGNNLALMGSEYCIYSGDINQDGVIDLTDSYQIYNDAAIGVSGYVKTDVTGDNFVDLSDLTLTINNANLFERVIRP